MRPPTSASSAWIAACVCAALALSPLLGPATAGAVTAPSLLGGAAPAATGAAPPAAGGAGGEVAKVKTAPAAKVKAAPAAATPAKTASTATTATTETSSNTSTPMIMAVVALFVVLGGIAFYILRDARSVAPVVEGATGGTRNPEGRLRKRRAQAKAARMQRKRHRKR
jgi:hypothetical protein